MEYTRPAWNKQNSLTPELRRREEKKWLQSVKVEKYRMHPPPDMVFGAIGSFHWLAAEFRPEEMFGPEYEVLDPIRMDCKCVVVYDGEKNLFRVMGTRKKVQEALQRIRMVESQLAARMISNVRLYLLHWPDATAMPTHVKLVEHELPAIMDRPSDDFLQSPRANCGDAGGSDVLPGSKQTSLSYRFLGGAMLQMISRLHFHRGTLVMRFRLGTLVATQFRKLPGDAHLNIGYKLGEYVDMIRESQFRGHVTQALGDKTVESGAHHRLKTAANLLVPDNLMVTSLQDVKPVYSAVYTFADPSGDLRYTINWKEMDSDSVRPEFDAIPRGWVQLDLDTREPRALFDVALTNLSVGSLTDLNAATSVALTNLNAASSWRFGIDAYPPAVTGVPKDLNKFVKAICFDAKRALDLDLQFALCGDQPNLKRIQQRITYAYRIMDSDYTLEITHFQDRVRNRKDGSATLYESRWSVEVFRSEWETMFGQNERLTVGKGTTWADDGSTWFPADLGPTTPVDGDGFQQLMEKLQKIERVVRSA